MGEGDYVDYISYNLHYVPLDVEEKRRRGIVVTNPIIDKRIGTRIDPRTTALINYNEYRIRRPSSFIMSVFSHGVFRV